MIKIYLVRHGQTSFNVAKRIQGQCDSPLTQEGKICALALNRYFNDIPLSCAYSARLYRCIDTMHMIVNHRCETHIMNAFDEISYGSLEGELKEDVIEQLNSSDFTSYGGESMDSFTTRIVRGLKSIVNDEDDTDILVVTSSAVIAQLLLFIDPTYFDTHPTLIVDNGSVTTIGYENHQFNIVEGPSIEPLSKGIDLLLTNPDADC